MTLTSTWLVVVTMSQVYLRTHCGRVGGTQRLLRHSISRYGQLPPSHWWPFLHLYLAMLAGPGMMDHLVTSTPNLRSAPSPSGAGGGSRGQLISRREGQHHDILTIQYLFLVICKLVYWYLLFW